MRVLFPAALVYLCSVGGCAREPVTAGLEQQAAGLTRQFVRQLKPELKQAMTEGGPVRAIEICADKAPAIADALSIGSGWNVSRVSLKSRNASRAVPDKWERQVLEQFDQRRAAGEAPAAIHYGEVVSGHYRYMQAQVVEPICLVCHGQDLSQPVHDTLEQYYPDDWATGYSLGEVRGAISVSRQL